MKIYLTSVNMTLYRLSVNMPVMAGEFGFAPQMVEGGKLRE
jgi:hypothetical protein